MVHTWMNYDRRIMERMGSSPHSIMGRVALLLKD